jgi:hypothetical protein
VARIASATVGFGILATRRGTPAAGMLQGTSTWHLPYDYEQRWNEVTRSDIADCYRRGVTPQHSAKISVTGGAGSTVFTRYVLVTFIRCEI